MERKREEKQTDRVSIPEFWPNRGNSAYESIRRGTRADSQVRGTRSRGFFRSGETTNDPPKNEVVDYGMIFRLSQGWRSDIEIVSNKTRSQKE